MDLTDAQVEMSLLFLLGLLATVSALSAASGALLISGNTRLAVFAAIPVVVFIMRGGLEVIRYA